MKIEKILFLTLLLANFCSTIFGQSIVANRTALDILLGNNRVDEGFETIPIGDNSAVTSDGLLSSTNSWGGGTEDFNLVVPGVTFESTGAFPAFYGIRWGGHNFCGTTKTISAGIGLRLDFWDPTVAFGIDLKDYPATRSVNLAGITIYGADDSTVLYQNNTFSITDPNSGTFFGYENPAGIGSVLFTVTQPGPFYEDKSPTIDNLSFSTVPEPSTVSLALAALGFLAFRYARRR
jgi:hypothetical protein